MKKYKLVIYIVFFVFVVLFIPASTIEVMAHENILDVDYDKCENVDAADGENEIWYSTFLETSGIDKT